MSNELGDLAVTRVPKVFPSGAMLKADALPKKC